MGHLVYMGRYEYIVIYGYMVYQCQMGHLVYRGRYELYSVFGSAGTLLGYLGHVLYVFHPV